MKRLVGLLLCCTLFAAALPAKASAVFYADGEDLVAVVENAPAETDFEHRQEMLCAWVKDVNYRTRVGLTERDRRLMTTFLNIITIGMSNFFMDNITNGMSTRVLKISSGEIERLKTEGRHDNIARHLPRAATEQLYKKIKEKPFLLLLIGEEDFKEICAHHPKVKGLFENMYTFFYHRSIVLGEEFNKNVDDIGRIAQDGKADPFHTWQLLADYTRRELESAKLEKRALQDLAYHFNRLKHDIKVGNKIRRRLQQKGVIPTDKQLRRQYKRPSVSQEADSILRTTPDSVLREMYLD